MIKDNRVGNEKEKKIFTILLKIVWPVMLNDQTSLTNVNEIIIKIIYSL